MTDPEEYVAKASPDLGQHLASIQVASDPGKMSFRTIIGRWDSQQFPPYRSTTRSLLSNPRAKLRWTCAQPHVPMEWPWHLPYRSAESRMGSLLSKTRQTVVNGINCREICRCSARAGLLFFQMLKLKHVQGSFDKLGGKSAGLWRTDGDIGSELGSAGRAW